MMKKTHILTSVTAGVALVHFTPMDPTIGLFLGIVAGSVLPDIDEPQSYIGRKTSVEVFNRRIGLSSVIKAIFGHRGFTHSLLATLLVFIPYLFMNGYVSQLESSGLIEAFILQILLGIGFGYLFHILGDLFSKSGVPLFMPLTKQKIAIPLYTTQKFSEKIIFGCSVILLGYLVYQEFLLHLFA